MGNPRYKNMFFSPRQIRIVGTAAIISVAVLAADCSKAPVSGVFVGKASPTEVEMIRMVESPPGHLSGSMVFTGLNQDGSVKTVNYSVSGSINGSNVSLQLGGGIAGLARFFGVNTLLVGNLKGRTLTLSIGNSTLVFHKVSDRKYQQNLTSLNTMGQHMALVTKSAKAMRDVISFDQSMDRSLKRYIAWGQARISYVPNVRRWYADRINKYSRCLSHVRPLAAAHVPVWQWQECALSIENDKYVRDQKISDIKNLEKQNQQRLASIHAKLSRAQTEFANMITMMRSACPYSNKVDACKSGVRKLQSMSSYGFINEALLSEFQELVPKVKAAINEDVGTGSAGEARLSSIARQVSSIYQSASRQ